MSAPSMPPCPQTTATWPLTKETEEAVIMQLLHARCSPEELVNVILACPELERAWKRVLHSSCFIKAIGSWLLHVGNKKTTAIAKLLTLGAGDINGVLSSMVHDTGNSELVKAGYVWVRDQLLLVQRIHSGPTYLIVCVSFFARWICEVLKHLHWLSLGPESMPGKC